MPVCSLLFVKLYLNENSNETHINMDVFLALSAYIIFTIPIFERMLINKRISNKSLEKLVHYSKINLITLLAATIIILGLGIILAYIKPALKLYFLSGALFWYYRAMLVNRIYINDHELIVGNQIYDLRTDYLVKEDSVKNLIFTAGKNDYKLDCATKTAKKSIQNFFQNSYPDNIVTYDDNYL